VEVFDGAALGCSVSSDGQPATESGDGTYTFAFVLDTAKVVTASGCIDSDTQLLLPILSGLMQSGAVVISPITTLIVEVAIANEVANGTELRTGARSISATTLESAIAQIVANLELGDYKPTDPATANYVATAKADTTGTSTAAKAMRVSLAISTLLKSIEISAGPADASAAVSAVSQAMANSLSAVDLTQSAGIEAVMKAAILIAPEVANPIKTASGAIVTLVTLIINSPGDITIAVDVTTIISGFLNKADKTSIAVTTNITKLVTTVTAIIVAAAPNCILDESTLDYCLLQ
jgi:hypothetical protein